MGTSERRVLRSRARVRKTNEHRMVLDFGVVRAEAARFSVLQNIPMVENTRSGRALHEKEEHEEQGEGSLSPKTTSYNKPKSCVVVCFPGVERTL